MANSTILSPKIIKILLIPVILFVSLVAASYIFPQPTYGSFDMKLQKIGGETIDTSSFKGKILIVEFFATWCEDCQKSTNNIASVKQHYKLNDVQILSISADPSHDSDILLNKFIKENNLTDYVGTSWFFARDMTKQHEDYGVYFVPTTFLVSKNSVIIAKHDGLLLYEDIINWLNDTQLVGPGILS